VKLIHANDPAEVGGVMDKGAAARFPAELLRDDDLEIFANEAPFRVLYLLADVARQVSPRTGNPVQATFVAALARLRAVEPWAAIGTIRGEEIPKVLHLARETVDAALACALDLPEERRRMLTVIARYIDEVALPRLVPPEPMADEDLESLSGLAPAGM